MDVQTKGLINIDGRHDCRRELVVGVSGAEACEDGGIAGLFKGAGHEGCPYEHVSVCVCKYSTSERSSGTRLSRVEWVRDMNAVVGNSTNSRSKGAGWIGDVAAAGG